jgi:phenylpyruvate tautomerase PptA (4-oxalocrotonate tautomerase family)
VSGRKEEGMPLYICSAPADSLDDDERQSIATAITRIHCDVTGAPATFAHVVFADSKAGDYSVFGTIRAGRTDEIKGELRRQMATAVAETAGIGADKVAVLTVDVPASWVMEGGALLPEPGEEDDWLAAHGEGSESADRS